MARGGNVGEPATAFRGEPVAKRAVRRQATKGLGKRLHI